VSRMFVSGGKGSFAGMAAAPAALGPDDVVAVVSDAWRAAPGAEQVVTSAIAALRGSDATAVAFLDARGEELAGLQLVRGRLDAPLPRSMWLPWIVSDVGYDPEAHRVEAEQYRDRIGDRLLRPEAVAPDKQHLIADDRQRAAGVLTLGYEGRVLDVGTSDGTLLCETVRRWELRDAVGVDVARSAIEEANAAAARDPALAGRVSFVESFIEDLRFPDGTFDTVSACETLEHIGSGQFPKAFDNLLRMLRPGGRMLMTVPNRYPDPRYEREQRARWAWPAHHQFFTELSVRRLLAPWFDRVEFFPLYEGEPAGDSIYLICRALGRR
jgi:SAM-dependent methyltransferase